MTLRIGAFHHSELNLNGDLQNLLILSRRLNARGVPCEVVDLSGANFESELSRGLDFAFVGHGSEAAWAAIDVSDPDLESGFLAVADAKVPILGVSSGFERLIRLGLTGLTLQKTERRSEFVAFEWQTIEIVGYLNSDSDAPLFFANGNIFGTMLHGPVFAKNPELADFFCNLISSRLGDVDLQKQSQTLRSLDDLASAAREVARGMISN
jgi:CobQ-like glutamine amidotransferase family enzyme